MCGVPIDAADDYLQRLIGARPPRRRLRADRGPGRGEEARRQIGGAARRGAPRHARHHHRGDAARSRPSQSSCSRSPARSVSDADWRYGLAAVDISTGAFRVERDRRAGPRGRDRPLRAARDPRAGRVLDDAGPRGLLARDPGARHAAAARRPRPGLGRAAPQATSSASRRSTASATFGRAEIAAAGSALVLCREDADRRAAAFSARRERRMPGRARHRCGDARQSRTDPHAVAASAPAACSPASTAR